MCGDLWWLPGFGCTCHRKCQIEMPPGDFLKCVQMCKLRRAHLLPPTPAQVLLAGQRADGADPRLGHAFDPQHHPAELLALRHHAVELLEAGPDLRLHTGTQSVWHRTVSVCTLLHYRTVCSFDCNLRPFISKLYDTVTSCSMCYPDAGCIILNSQCLISNAFIFPSVAGVTKSHWDL